GIRDRLRGRATGAYRFPRARVFRREGERELWTDGGWRAAPRAGFRTQGSARQLRRGGRRVWGEARRVEWKGRRERGGIVEPWADGDSRLSQSTSGHPRKDHRWMAEDRRRLSSRRRRLLLLYGPGRRDVQLRRRKHLSEGGREFAVRSPGSTRCVCSS